MRAQDEVPPTQRLSRALLHSTGVRTAGGLGRRSGRGGGEGGEGSGGGGGGGGDGGDGGMRPRLQALNSDSSVMRSVFEATRVVPAQAHRLARLLGRRVLVRVL